MMRRLVNNGNPKCDQRRIKTKVKSEEHLPLDLHETVGAAHGGLYKTDELIA
jgi:hypothetical protein